MEKSKQPLLLITVLILIWGASWPVYKMSVPYIPPLFFSSIRAIGGGLLLAIIIWKMKSELKIKEYWYIYVISAIFNTTLFIALQTISLNYLPSSMVSVIVYLQPVIVGLLSWLLVKEKMTILKLSGLILGFIGVGIVSIDGLNSSFSIIGILIALSTALFWGIGVVFIKRFSGNANPYWIVAMQLLIGGLLLFILSISTEDITNVTWNIQVLTGVVFGVTVGLPLAYYIYYKLIREGEASKVAASTFLVPIIAVLISVIFLGESLTGVMVIGIVLVVLSVYAVNKS